MFTFALYPLSFFFPKGSARIYRGFLSKGVEGCLLYESKKSVKHSGRGLQRKMFWERRRIYLYAVRDSIIFTLSVTTHPLGHTRDLSTVMRLHYVCLRHAYYCTIHVPTRVNATRPVTPGLWVIPKARKLSLRTMGNRARVSRCLHFLHSKQ